MTKILASRIVTTRVDERTADRLEQLARESDRSVSAEVRRALRSHLEHEQQPAERRAE
jgi:predicted transcriptional regulator